MAKKAPHIHKYLRTKQYPNSNVLVFRCMMPGCTHFLPLTFIEGQISICWKCTDPFVINKTSMTRKKPKCNTCISKGRKDGIAKERVAVKNTPDVKYSSIAREIQAMLEREE